MRMPDVYYTSTMLDGVNKQMSPNQMPLLFNQGEDIVFTIYLNVDGVALNTSKHDLYVVLKKSNSSQYLRWRSTSGTGITEVSDGYFKVWMPAIASMFLQQGSYHIGFLAKEKIGKGDGPKDRTFTVAEQMIVVRKPTASVYDNVLGVTPVLDPTLGWLFRLEDGNSIVIGGTSGSDAYRQLEDMVINSAQEIVTVFDMTTRTWQVSLIPEEGTTPSPIMQ